VISGGFGLETSPNFDLVTKHGQKWGQLTQYDVFEWTQYMLKGLLGETIIMDRSQIFKCLMKKFLSSLGLCFSPRSIHVFFKS
jgi:hypothetical protein